MYRPSRYLHQNTRYRISLVFAGIAHHLVQTAMPKGFSEDLRWTVVYMVCLQGKTIQEVPRDM